MTKFLLFIAALILFARCTDKNKMSIQSQSVIDSLDYADKQQGKTDSLEELRHDSVILKTFEGPAMTTLGDAPKKQRATQKHIKTKNH